MSITLLFPGGMPESLAELHRLTAQGRTAIGASSLPTDPSKPLYTHWAFMPMITDSGFEATLLAFVQSHNITRIFTRHPIIARYLTTIIANHRLAITLDAATFAAEAIQQQQSIFSRVDHLLSYPLNLEIVNSRPPLNRLEIASFILHTLRVEGQSSDEKIFAVMEIARSLPNGDVIEIGSFWGRSACLLAMLAQHYAIGSLLCIDPWANDAAHQHGVPEHVNDEARAINFANAHDGFLMNLRPYHVGHINFIRGQAHFVSTRYAPGLKVSSNAFGDTSYTGKIACLHIDGNHDLEHITQDIADWTPHVVSGGWMIIDDYQWAFGDGPQCAADTWMGSHRNLIARAFVAGSALFIRMA